MMTLAPGAAPSWTDTCPISPRPPRNHRPTGLRDAVLVDAVLEAPQPVGLRADERGGGGHVGDLQVLAADASCTMRWHLRGGRSLFLANSEIRSLVVSGSAMNVSHMPGRLAGSPTPGRWDAQRAPQGHSRVPHVEDDTGVPAEDQAGGLAGPPEMPPHHADGQPPPLTVEEVANSAQASAARRSSFGHRAKGDDLSPAICGANTDAGEAGSFRGVLAPEGLLPGHDRVAQFAAFHPCRPRRPPS